MLTPGLQTISEKVVEEFRKLASRIHRREALEPSFYLNPDSLFMETGSRKMSEQEFDRLAELIQTHALPLEATCHAKWGGFFFVLHNPLEGEPATSVLFGFEMKQVPVASRAALKSLYTGTENRTLLGAYNLGSNVDTILPYLDHSHSKSWEEYG